MSFLHKLRPSHHDGPVPVQAPNNEDVEIQSGTNAIAPGEGNNAVDTELKDKIETPTPDAQLGVQKIEAITLAWTKKSLAALLIMYASRFFPNCLESVSFQTQLTPSPSAGSGSFFSPMGLEVRFSGAWYPMSRAISNPIHSYP